MLLLIATLLGLRVCGVSVAVALAGGSLVYVLVSGAVPAIVLAQRMIAGIESLPLLARGRAAWLHCRRGVDETGRAWPIDDPQATTLRALHQNALVPDATLASLPQAQDPRQEPTDD